MNKNLLHTMAAGLLLCAGLASCEMKEELWGGSESSETGFLNLGVAVNASQNVITKAEEDAEDGVVDNGEQTGEAVSAADFPVSINGVTDPTYSKNFEAYADLEDQNPIELPTGDYTVTAHSNLELEPIMSVPFYEGTFEKLTVTKDITAEANVVCKMKNTRIKLNYTSDFTANFKTWTITMTDGSANILTFTDKDADAANPAAKYWLIAENVSQITINVNATNLNDEPVKETRVLTKPTGSDSDYWTGGDALTVDINGVTPDPEDPNGVSGIDITVNVTFEEEEEPVEVPVTPGTGGGDEPTPGPDPEPSEDTPTVSSKYLGQTITFSKAQNNAPNDVVVDMSAPQGIQHVYIKATTTDPVLEGIFTAIGFMTGNGLDFVGLDKNPSAGEIAPLFDDLPEVGDTSYPFVLGSLASMLTVGEHSFTVTVVDQEDNESTPQTIYFNVTQ